MKAMILAAGFGTRFRPATYELPKPLIPLCNEPLIGYAIRNLIAAGVTEIVINLHHLPEKLEQWVSESFGSEAQFHFSFEPEILGTGGGIRNVRHLLEADEDFLLVNGDTVQQPPLDALMQTRRAQGSVAALVLRQPPEGDRFTRVWFEDGRITGFGDGSGTPLMFSGSHVISREIFSLLPDRPFSGITEDVYLPLTKQRPGALGAVIDQGFWFDIGTPLRYQSAATALLRLMVGGEVAAPQGSEVRGSSLIDMTARVEGTVEDSSIGSGCVIEAGATVTDSSLWWNAHIAADATISGSIIGADVAVPSGYRVENALLCRRLDVDYAEGITVNEAFAWVAVDPQAPARVEPPRS